MLLVGPKCGISQVTDIKSFTVSYSHGSYYFSGLGVGLSHGLREVQVIGILLCLCQDGCGERV